MNLRNRIMAPIFSTVFVLGLASFLLLSWSVRDLVNDQVATRQDSIHENLAESVDTKIHDFSSSLAALEKL